MVWQAPKTDWDSSKGVADTDLNRIEGNTAQLKTDSDNHVGSGGASHAAATTGTNGFMSASDKLKLDGIEAGAKADQTAAEILAALKTVDGAGSGLDADTLDGISSASFVRSDAADTLTAILTAQNNTSYTTKQVRNITLSTGSPSGGSNGDIWIKYK